MSFFSVFVQMDMSLSSLDCETLTKAFRENAYDHERAAIRLLQSLSLRGFSQSRVLQFKADIIWKVARLIRYCPLKHSFALGSYELQNELQLQSENELHVHGA